MPYFCSMKKCLTIFSVFMMLVLVYSNSSAQCAMCTKTAQQLGEKPAQGMNSGILYLAFAPFAIVGFIGLNSGILYLMLMPFAIMGFIAYRWWKGRVTTDEDNAA